MKDFIELLKQHDEIKIISTPLDCELEIAHVAYLEAKQPNPKALLFTSPISNNKKLNIPVLMNLFANETVLNLVLGTSADAVANRISELLNLHIPNDLAGKVSLASRLYALKNIAPKRKISTKAACKERSYALDELPVLKTWPDDAGRFITMGQVYTQSLDGKANNLGMYRLQLAKDSLGYDGLIMHFQLHKDANNFYYEYKKAGKNMPIAVAIGAHPLHILCAQAPLPRGIFELVLAGFIANKPASLVKCDTNDLYVPAQSDFVIEGYIDINEPLALEGPFGDHTGFYTPQGHFPIMKINKITGKKDAIFSATVVGKPPLEDKLMGYATERIFAPLLRQSVPLVVDYRLPENGCFHNLCVVKIRNEYPAAALSVAHAFFGLGQMAFCKNIIIVDEAAPALSDNSALSEHILQNIKPENIHTSFGLSDELDHSSEQIGQGGKLIIDACTISKCQAQTKRQSLSENKLDIQCQSLTEANLIAMIDAIGAKSYNVFFQASKMPIICLHLEHKPGNIDRCFKLLQDYIGQSIVVLFNDAISHAPYMLLYRALSNFDAARDIRMNKCGILIDACSKDSKDGYDSVWPTETMCDDGVLLKLIKEQVIQADFALFKKFELLTDMQLMNLKEQLNGDF